jgi:segregation and condensation protein B
VKDSAPKDGGSVLSSEQRPLLTETSFGPQQLLESLLFVAAEPVPVRDLAQALELAPDTVETLLARLAAEYCSRGIRIQRHHDRVQLVSAPEATAVIERFLGVQSSTRLSNATLETLAIIAYQQPVTRANVEAIRGVDCSGALRTLLQCGLVTEVGRMQTVGRPVLYGTTEEFLKQFGLDSIAQLPPLEAGV